MKMIRPLTATLASGAITRIFHQGPLVANATHIRPMSIRTLSTPTRALNTASYIEDNLELTVEQPDSSTTVVGAKLVSTGREGKLVKIEHDKACTLCRLNLRNLDYTDVLILSNYIKRNGSIVTYHESKLCSKQYRKVVKLIEQAQRCNLMARPADYLVPGAWHDLNTYLEPDRRRDQPMKVVKKEYWKL